MSKIGYYRYKTTVEDGKTVAFFKNSAQSGLATIKALEYCDGYKILKYLDNSSGQYKFFSFTRFFEENDRPSKIGSTNEFITNLKNAQSNSKNIGYRNKRSMSLSAEVNSDELLVLSEIYKSPRVYLYIGNGTSDILSDWVLLDDISGDNTVRRRKQNTGLVNINVTLPEWFTVKMV